MKKAHTNFSWTWHNTKNSSCELDFFNWGTRNKQETKVFIKPRHQNGKAYLSWIQTQPGGGGVWTQPFPSLSTWWRVWIWSGFGPGGGGKYYTLTPDASKMLDSNYPPPFESRLDSNSSCIEARKKSDSNIPPVWIWTQGWGKILYTNSCCWQNIGFKSPPLFESRFTHIYRHTDTHYGDCTEGASHWASLMPRA